MITITKGKGNEYETISEYNSLRVAYGFGEKVSMAG
jgi:hypothetical protein